MYSQVPNTIMGVATYVSWIIFTSIVTKSITSFSSRVIAAVALMSEINILLDVYQKNMFSIILAHTFHFLPKSTLKKGSAQYKEHCLFHLFLLSNSNYLCPY